MIQMSRVEFALNFAAIPVLHSRLAEFAAEKVGETFSGDGAILRLRLPTDRVDALSILLADLSRGRASVRRLDSN
jgi:putative IMPACT (imprinted ancient) family translation regulator